MKTIGFPYVYICRYFFKIHIQYINIYKHIHQISGVKIYLDLLKRQFSIALLPRDNSGKSHSRTQPESINRRRHFMSSQVSASLGGGCAVDGLKHQKIGALKSTHNVAFQCSIKSKKCKTTCEPTINVKEK